MFRFFNMQEAHKFESTRAVEYSILLFIAKDWVGANFALEFDEIMGDELGRRLGASNLASFSRSWCVYSHVASTSYVQVNFRAFCTGLRNGYSQRGSQL